MKSNIEVVYSNFDVKVEKFNSNMFVSNFEIIVVGSIFITDDSISIFVDSNFEIVFTVSVVGKFNCIVENCASWIINELIVSLS